MAVSNNNPWLAPEPSGSRSLRLAPLSSGLLHRFPANSNLKVKIGFFILSLSLAAPVYLDYVDSLRLLQYVLEKGSAAEAGVIRVRAVRPVRTVCREERYFMRSSDVKKKKQCTKKIKTSE